MEPLPPFLRVADLARIGHDDRSLRRRAHRGELTRVVSGVYAETSTWRALSDRQQAISRIHATVGRLARRVAISHWSAVAVHGLPHADGWPAKAQVTDPALSKSRSSPTLLRRSGSLASSDVMPWAGLWVTTPARTAGDIALTEPFDNAVVVVDQGLRLGLFAKDEVRAELARRPSAHRLSSALRAVEFASGLAEYAGESFSRVNLAARGFEAPVLQEPFRDTRGLIGYGDFWWEAVGVVGEFDGDWKYTDPRWLRGRTASEAIIDEKRRQARMEAHPRVNRVVRWDYAVARDPGELARRLLAAGVPLWTAANRRGRAS